MRTNDGVRMPKRATLQSAGYDFFAPADIAIKAGEWTEFGTGVYLDGTEALVGKEGARVVTPWMLMLLPRSGLGFKYAVRLANTAGVVDPDYRGEIRCKLTADKNVMISKGTAYMQGLFVPVLYLLDEDIPTEVRSGGFGSTDARSGLL